ncbi:MAG: Abi family protein [Firmicutes bacterium]|nr:Abi family protein [Bacillota bacterium]
MQRLKISIEDQIEHMKFKGVKFNIINEEQAKQYLCDNTYFFKIKAYAKMFDTYRTGDKKGKYVDLEFAYLRELAVIDMHLRHFILKAAVDVEHAIKVQFMDDFNNCSSNGYDIVDEYFQIYPDLKNKILRKKDNSYCEDLIDKLEKEGYAVWNLIEIISFGDFINLYRLFYEKYPPEKGKKIYAYPMYNIKSLRNAAAHNNCILNQLMKGKNSRYNHNKKVISFVSKIDGIGKAEAELYGAAGST